MTNFFQAIMAQIDKSQLTDLNNLPSKFDKSNVQNGLTIAFGVAGGIALIIVAYGGFKFVLSQGNPQEISKAKNTIIDGLIGLVVIIAASGIVSFVVRALT